MNSYWNQDTEDAVVEYLEMETRFLKRKKEDYLKNNRDYDIKVESEMTKRIDWSESIEAQSLRDRLYREKLQAPLNLLVEDVLSIFKLENHDIDVRVLKDVCVGFIFEKISNFNPYLLNERTGKATKAFSYLRTLTKCFSIRTIKEMLDSNNEESHLI